MRVSIVSMVKNEEKFIAASMLSVLGQKNIELEIIVVDDHSTDETFSILQTIEAADPRVKVFKNPGQGKVSAFQYGCNIAKGQYIACFAGDDIMPEGSLLERCDEMDRIPSPAVLLSKIMVMSEDKKIDGMLIPKAPGKGNPSGASIMMDKSAAIYLLDIPSSLPNEDTWMHLCIRFIRHLNVRSHDTVSCMWRVHSGNSITIQQGFSQFNKKFTLRMNALYVFKEKFLNILDASDIKKLDSVIECENFRRERKLFKILLCDAPVSDKIRSIFYMNNFFFVLRRLIKSI